MTPQALEGEIALVSLFLDEQIEYARQNNLKIYPASYICKSHDHLISKAMRGDPHVVDILWDFANALTIDAKPLPPWLQEYVVWAARHGGSHRQRGRDPHANRHRNFVIACAVNRVVDRGFCPTRNIATTDECGCSIVAKGLESIGIHMSEANVAAIWRAVIRADSSEPETQPEGHDATSKDGTGCHCAQGDCANLKHFGPHFDDRMAALGSVALVSRDKTAAIDLRDVVGAEVTAYFEGDERITTCGPSTRLHKKASETTTLALRELTYHAVMQGALARPQGRLDVNWAITGGVLVLEWRERGVEISGLLQDSNPRERPHTRGYCRQLIEVAIPLTLGVRTRLEFVPHGMYCRIELPDYESPLAH